MSFQAEDLGMHSPSYQLAWDPDLSLVLSQMPLGKMRLDMDRDLQLVALHHLYMHMVMDLDPGEVVAFELDNELAQALDL